MSDRTSSPAPTSPSATQQKSEITDPPAKEDESSTLSTLTASVKVEEAGTKIPSSPLTWKTRDERRDERRAFLEKDPQIEEVEPWRVRCRFCEKWIKLSGQSAYTMSNWLSHRQRCSSSSPIFRKAGRAPSKPGFKPASRVATAERNIALLNDPQVRACSARRVLCGTCKSVVALDGEVDYDLTKWAEHKQKCIPMTPAPIAPQEPASHRGRVFPTPPASNSDPHVAAGRSPRSPTPPGENTSRNSTEATVVTESPPAAVKIGVKRGREEEAEDEEVEVRPTNRPRTESYKPQEKEAPSLFGWFSLPLQEFARGFREGMGST